MERPAVLVAEPDALQRQLLDVLLSGDDFDVKLVASGQEALAYLREHTPAAMLLAVELPDVDGFTLCQKAKVVGRLARVPVVLVANPVNGGGLDEETRSRARATGADLLLQRPLGDKGLRDRLTQLIRRPPEGGSGSVQEADLIGEEAMARPASGASLGSQAASELGRLRAEAAQLRGENASLKARLAKYKDLAKSLQEQLDGERKKPKGLFGRRG